MTYKLLTFQVRLKTDQSSSEITTRLEHIFNCSFQPESGELFPNCEAAVCEVMGVRLTIVQYLNKSQGEQKYVYWLTGDSSNDFFLFLQGDYTLTDIDDFVLAVLHLRDSTNWYKPSREEILRESGLL